MIGELICPQQVEQDARPVILGVGTGTIELSSPAGIVAFSDGTKALRDADS